MTVRTSRRNVTFTQPFSLSGIDEVQPAGTYTVGCKQPRKGTPARKPSPAIIAVISARTTAS